MEDRTSLRLRNTHFHRKGNPLKFGNNVFYYSTMPNFLRDKLNFLNRKQYIRFHILSGVLLEKYHAENWKSLALYFFEKYKGNNSTKSKNIKVKMHLEMRKLHCIILLVSSFYLKLIYLVSEVKV